ncbi:serine/arginine repetitive matrix protein 2-like [Mytilus californianus]|uniref:serine/arginine repetitive matrix protein 2-like n=1 Tax=Mytilus californianus TaxID=6549 RepID=UPI002247A188|nr:serine/arginine repetitive matrix protein 2-like [Mytilus californianus]
MKKPSDNWMKFELVKIKFKSNKRKECEDYDFTTTAELSPDEADSDHGKKRILKKKVFQDFITEIGNEEGTKATDKSVGASKNGKNKDKGESQATVPRNQEKSSSMPKPPTKLIERNAQCKELVTEKKSSSQTSNHRDSRSPSQKLSSSQTSNHRESRSPSKKLKSTNTLKSTTRPSTRQESPPFRQKSRSRSPLITQRSRSRSRSPPLSQRSRSRSPPNNQTWRSRSRSYSPPTDIFSKLKSIYSYSSKSTTRSPTTQNPSQRKPSNTTQKSTRPSIEEILQELKKRSSHSLHTQKSKSSEDRSHSTGNSQGSRSSSPLEDYLLPSSQSQPQRVSTNNNRARSRSPLEDWQSFSSNISSRSHVRENTSTPAAKNIPSGRKTSNNSETFPMSDERFQRRVLFLLTEIRDLLKKDQCATTAQTHCELERAETLDEFFELENALDDVAQQTRLTEYLRRIGGAGSSDLMKKAMTRMMSNIVMARMNLKGKKNKIAFLKTKLYKVISGCVMMVYPEITETKVKEDIGKFLKYAPERAGGGGRTSKD